MTAAAGTPLAPPGRSHLRPVPAGDHTDDPTEDRVPLPRSGTAPDPALVTLAERVQAAFRYRGLSLTDPDTAYVFGVSLEAVLPILDGALATGLMTEDQHRILRSMFEAAGSTPTIL